MIQYGQSTKQHKEWFNYPTILSATYRLCQDMSHKVNCGVSVLTVNQIFNIEPNLSTAQDAQLPGQLVVRLRKMTSTIVWLSVVVPQGDVWILNCMLKMFISHL